MDTIYTIVSCTNLTIGPKNLNNICRYGIMNVYSNPFKFHSNLLSTVACPKIPCNNLITNAPQFYPKSIVIRFTVDIRTYEKYFRC